MPKDYEKTTAGLRELLFDSALGIKNGTLPPAQGAIVAKLAHEIVGTLEVELKAQMQAFQLELGSEDAAVISPPLLQLASPVAVPAPKVKVVS